MTTPTYYGHAMDGYADGQGAQEPASLQETGHLWSQAASGGYQAKSVLQQTMIAPGNGRSERDAQRVLPGGQYVLPSGNGTSEQTTQAQWPLRAAGDLPI
jgi:hypothetical protein